MRKLTVSVWLFLFLFVAGTAWPQAGVGSIRGVAQDPSQAMVPGATVTLMNTATNVTRTTKTNEVGSYTFVDVQPGPYKITIEAAGLKTFEGTLTLQVLQDTRVDAILALSTSSTQVEVKDVTQMLQTDNVALGHTVETKRIEELPINGRSYQNLLMTTVPGMDSTGLPQAYGMRTNTSVTLFDGTAVNETYEGWDFSRPPGLDSISEIHVEINNSSAKFSRPTTITLSSKSGTNSLHGSLFETNRNSGYGVARRRQDAFVKPPPLNRNEFGASLGGPVYIPKLYNGKNKTFFFFAWEDSRQINGSTGEYNVPTLAMRNGDFRGLVDSSGRNFNLFDPATTDPVTYQRAPLSCNGVVNTICPNRLSPTGKYLLGITPLPTLSNVNPLVDFNFIAPFTGITNGSNTSIRIDHHFSDMDLLYGRYAYNTFYQLSQYSAQPMLDGVAGTENSKRPNQTIGLTWVHTFSPTMTNEMLLAGSRENEFRGMGDRTTNYDAKLGYPNPFNYTDFPATNALGNPNTSTGLDAYQFATDGQFTLVTNFVTFEDNVTKIRGKHQISFGFHGRFELLDNNRALYGSGPTTADTLATGQYDPTTSDSPTALNYTGFGLAEMYLGAFNYTSAFTRPAFNWRQAEYAGYIQDDWRATNRLTINVGLRYEVRPPIYDKTAGLVSFSIPKHAFVIGSPLSQYMSRGATLPSIVNAIQGFGGSIITADQAGLPNHLMYTNWKQLGPRLGMAYKALDGKKSFVIRSGFRVSYYPQKMQDWAENQYASVPGSFGFEYNVSDPTLTPDGLPNWGLRSPQQYIAGVNAGSAININDTRLFTRGFNSSFLDPKHVDGRVMDWNFTLEKEVMANTVVRAAYVGNYSTNQQQYVGYNDSTPAYIWEATTATLPPTGDFANVATRPYDQQVYGNINLFTAMGWSHHNSWQFEMERRFSKGVGFQVFYRTAKTMLVNRDTDNTQSGETLHSINYYLPGAVPTDLKVRDRFLNYKLDPNTPRDYIGWNFVVDVPLGRGKKLGNNMNRALDKVVGGWQIAGIGNWKTTFFSLPTTNWFVDPTIQSYGYQHPIMNCTSGACQPGYLWFNGYISASQLNTVDANGVPTGIEGVPANYHPAAHPFIQWGQTSLPANAPATTSQATLKTLWDTNNVYLPITNGTPRKVVFNNNLNPWRNQYVPGPLQWSQDASLFKFVQIHEKVNLRFNIDFFNVLNNPNNPTAVASTGILATRNSGSNARVAQLTGRLTW